MTGWSHQRAGADGLVSGLSKNTGKRSEQSYTKKGCRLLLLLMLLLLLKLLQLLLLLLLGSLSKKDRSMRRDKLQAARRSKRAVALST